MRWFISVVLAVLAMPCAGIAVAGEVDTGHLHSCVVAADRSIQCWGLGESGRLGNGSADTVRHPVAVFGTQQFKSVSAGYDHTCGLTVDDVAWCWGAGAQGQLGDGLGQSSDVPLQVAGQHHFVEISAGVGHTCGIDDVGKVWCWGRGSAGQLGTNGAVSSLVPVAEISGRAFVRVAAGDEFTCAIETSRQAWCWGQNDEGQLGTGLQGSSDVATKVSGAHAFDAISAGEDHVCAVDGAGLAWCWGQNAAGQLGTGAQEAARAPVAVIGEHAFESIAAGSDHTCAVARGGQLLCWGASTEGALGLGATIQSLQPAAVGAVHGPVREVAASGSHSCAVAEDGVVSCWGLDGHGQLGRDLEMVVVDPVQAIGLADVLDIGLGELHACALDAFGTARCWGVNAFGLLGNGVSATAGWQPVPTPVAGDHQFTSLVLGAYHACALDAGGVAWCWGMNDSGAAGAPASSAVGTPTAITGHTFRRLAAGRYHTCGIDALGEAWCWGRDDAGQLGNDAALAGSDMPVLVDKISSAAWTSISAGNTHTCAGTATGGVFCWGAADDGKLGIGQVIGEPLRPTPVSVAGLPGGAVLALELGANHSCAAKAAGASADLYCWGNNAAGQLGIGGGARLAPQNIGKVRGTASVVPVIAAGRAHMCVQPPADTDPATLCWGENTFGQLARAPLADIAVPAGESVGFRAALKIAAGDSNSCAILADRTVACAGDRSLGVLGDGTRAVSDVPVEVQGVTGLRPDRIFANGLE